MREERVFLRASPSWAACSYLPMSSSDRKWEILDFRSWIINNKFSVFKLMGKWLAILFGSDELIWLWHIRSGIDELVSSPVFLAIAHTLRWGNWRSPQRRWGMHLCRSSNMADIQARIWYWRCRDTRGSLQVRIFIWACSSPHPASHFDCIWIRLIRYRRISQGSGSAETSIYILLIKIIEPSPIPKSLW